MAEQPYRKPVSTARRNARYRKAMQHAECDLQILARRLGVPYIQGRP